MGALRRDVERDLDITTGTSRRGVQLVDSNMHTYLFEVDKKEGDAGMRSSRNEYKVISVKNRVMAFTCEELRELVRQYYDLEQTYQVQQEALADKVLDIVATYYPLLEKVSGVVAQLDVLASFASVALQYGYTKPKILGEDI